MTKLLPSSGSDGQPVTPPTNGVFITKGMRVGVPEGGFTLRIGSDGGLNANLTLHAALHVTAHWFAIAWNHLQVAEQEHSKLVPAWQAQASNEVGTVLEAEFAASMQVSVAAAIALDAFYAVVKEQVEIPPQMLEAWHRRSTARYKQVFETFRRGFKISKVSLPEVRKIAKEVYRFRNLAVHPHARLTQPILHPDLGVATEWRFVYFRLENARSILNISLSLIAQLLDVPDPTNERLKQYCMETWPSIEPLVQQWGAKYGPLYPNPKHSGNSREE